MQAVIANTLGPPENYELQDVPVPQPKAGEVQIAVHYAGMGFVDSLVAQGLYQVKPPTPYCPGMEVVGRVSQFGSAVTDLADGDWVVGSAFGGGLAEFVCARADACYAIPEQLDPRAAAGFIVNYTTAWHALIDRAQLQAGETVLVLGAAGGTGIAAVQVARMAGAHVIAGASTQAKRDFAMAHGAHASVDYSQPDWRDTLKAMTTESGLDVVFDPVGGDLLEPAFRSLSWRGRHLVIGFAGGPIPALPVNLALLKGASLVGVDLRQFSSVHEADAAAGVRDKLFAAVRRGDLLPPAGQSFALSDFRAAMKLASSRDGMGKTVIQISTG